MSKKEVLMAALEKMAGELEENKPADKQPSVCASCGASCPSCNTEDGATEDE